MENKTPGRFGSSFAIIEIILVHRAENPSAQNPNARENMMRTGRCSPPMPQKKKTAMAEPSVEMPMTSRAGILSER